MRVAIVVGCIAITTTVAAGPRKVLVLPLDGTADAALRTKLAASVQKLSASIDGEVTNGDTTYPETAAAVGCDPNKPSCVDSVLTTLAVDELVWGTARTANGKTTITVRRATKGAPVREQSTTIQSPDPADKAEGGLQPLFGPVAPVGSADVGSGSAVVDAAKPLPPGPPVDTRQRDLGIGLAVGGGAALIVGLALWSHESGLQSEIDAHAALTLADIQALKKLEDSASAYAWGGNILILIGLGVGAAGGYYLWKDHQHHKATLTPAPVETGTGMTLVLGGRW